MEQPKVIRKIQFRQGSYAVTIPKKMVQILGIERDQYMGISVLDGRLYIDPIPVIEPDGTAEYRRPVDADGGSTADNTQEVRDKMLDGLSM